MPNLEEPQLEPLVTPAFLEEQPSNGFSETFSHQESLARVASLVENQLRDNPEISLPDLHAILVRQAGLYKLTPDELQVISQRMELYRKSGEEITQLVEEYQEKGSNWEALLFADMFGAPPVGEVKLRVEPHFLYWEVSETPDFLTTGKKLREVVGDQPTDDIDQLIRGSAFVFPRPLMGEHINVGIKRMPQNPKQAVVEHLAGRYVDKHEERHGIDFLLDPLADPKELLGPVLALTEQSTEEEVSGAVAEVVKGYEPLGYRMARSEMLAFFEPSEMFVKDMKRFDPFDWVPADRLAKHLPAKGFDYIGRNTGNKDKKEAARYDYSEILRQRLESYLVLKTGKKWEGILEGELSGLKGEFWEKVLSGVVASKVLAHHSELSPHEFMWLLQNQPLERWPTLVRAAGAEVWEEYTHALEKARGEWQNAGRL